MHLLGYIGGKMLIEGIRGEETEEAAELSAGTLFMQGVATSIDALSVGFTISEYGWLMALAASGIIAGRHLLHLHGGPAHRQKVRHKLSGKASVLGGMSSSSALGWKIIHLRACSSLKKGQFRKLGTAAPPKEEL